MPGRVSSADTKNADAVETPPEDDLACNPPPGLVSPDYCLTLFLSYCCRKTYRVLSQSKVEDKEGLKMFRMLL